MKDADITICAIGIGNETNETQLKQMAFDNRHLFQIATFQDLANTVNILKVYTQLCKTIFARNVNVGFHDRLSCGDR